jgi:hypothetical protein
MIHSLDVLIGLLVVGVIDVRLIDAGPYALIEKLPVVVERNVVTTKTYVLPDCRRTFIRN